MVKRPYRIKRQEHLGRTFDSLQAKGRLEWKWAYDGARRRAIFNVKLRGESWQALDTKRAEAVAQTQCDELGIRWLPVPHPGGEAQYEAIKANLKGLGYG